MVVQPPSGNILVDGDGSAAFTLGGVLGGTTAITVVAVGINEWYVIGKF